jgi:A/G-specific adenine glycosylase
MAPATTAKISILEFRRHLLAWFDANARDLPWRRTRDPYPIWLSEIMLQQTRVVAVMEYYARFLTLFPSIDALASAHEDQVLAAWSGLGYYRRARMLHRAAQVIVREFQGKFPRSPAELRSLPGIGEYTAAAVSSIAFGEPVPVVDGNVERVIQRVFALPGDSRKKETAQGIRERADALLDRQRSGDFNQSMMELGATVCLPRNPFCMACPVLKFCLTRGEHPVEPRKAMHSRQIGYALLGRRRDGGEQILLQRRSAGASQMPGMWELPEISLAEDDRERVELTLRHAITVTNYQVRVLRLAERERRQRLLETATGRRWTSVTELETLPLTGLARKILRRLKILPARHAALAVESR